MQQTENRALPPPHLIRSLTAVIIGSLLLRAAAGAMGQNIQFFFNSIQQAAIQPDSPLRVLFGSHRVYQISYTLGGIIIGSFFTAELIGAIFFGAWSDRYGRKLFIIFGPLFGAVAVQITALTTVIWLLVFTRLLEGLSTASNAPATLGYIAEASAHSPNLRTRVVGFFEVATIGGSAVGFSLGGWLWHNYGAPAVVGGISLASPAFALNALIYLASLVILWLGIHEIREKKATNQDAASVSITLKHYWKIVRSPQVAGFAPAWIAINAVLGIWINLSARILTDKTRHFNQLLVGRFNSQQVGNILAGYAAFFILGILIWTFFFANLKKTTAMLIGAIGLVFSCLLLFIINHQPTLTAPLVIPLAVLFVLSIMVQSGFTPSAVAHLADITEPHAEDRGAIMGLYSVFLGLGSFIGLSIGGPFVDWLGADGIALANALLGLFAAFLVLQLRKYEDRHDKSIQSKDNSLSDL